MDREETVARMKQQLDDWNARIGDWETRMHDAQESMKAGYRDQIDALRRQREEGMSRLKELQASSEAAWGDMSKGFEDAWKHLAEGFESAWSEFRQKEQGRKEQDKDPS